MHKQAAYLYKNVQTLYLDLVPIGLGYRKVYARPMKLYKGIDNEFALRLMNGDQKLVNAVGKTLHWLMLDRDTSELKYRTSKVVQGSDNSMITISLSEGELEPLKSGHYMYSTYLEDNTGKRTILYGDSQFGASVPVEVVENSFPQIKPSQEILSDDFITSENIDYVEPDDSLYTSALDAYPDLNGQAALHTAVFYSTGYDGSIQIEASLENGVTDIIQWSVIDTVEVSSDESIQYVNFEGVFSWIRFRMIPDMGNTGTIDKILYRS